MVTSAVPGSDETLVLLASAMPYVPGGSVSNPTPIPSPPGWASDPQLEMLWTTPPPFLGDLPANSVTPVSNPTSSNPFTVGLGTLQTGEQNMLDATAAVVLVYNRLESQVQNAISDPGFFGQWAQTEAYRQVSVPTELPTDDFATSAQQVAASLNPGMTRILRMVADTTTACGAFINMINLAGQAYTASDKHSTLSALNDPTS
jgi:hypothetical protein